MGNPFSKLKKAWDSFSDGVKTVLEKAWVIVRAIGLGIWELFSFIIDVISGDAIKTWGLAPYLALPGLIMFPLNAMVPGLEEILLSPFEFIGISETALTFYQFMSGIYYLFIIIYNIYEGKKLK